MHAVVALGPVLVLDRNAYGPQLQYFLMQSRAHRVHVLDVWLFSRVWPSSRVPFIATEVRKRTRGRMVKTMTSPSTC